MQSVLRASLLVRTAATPRTPLRPVPLRPHPGLPRRLVRPSSTMVPDTDFTHALNKPSDLIQSLYDKATDKSAPTFARDVESHFRTTFAHADARSKIPVLSQAVAQPLLQQQHGSTSSTAGKLVRWRCMVQDTGLGTEVFLSSSSAQGHDSARCGLFGAENSAAAHSDADDFTHVDSSKLGERTVVYAVSVPGRSDWARRAWGEDSASSASSASQTPSATDRDGQGDELSSKMAATSLLDEPQSPQKVEEVRQRIRAAVEKGKAVGGSGKEPRLVAVSKLHPPSAILAAHRQAGQLHFGENYVQEMVDKAKVLPREIRWHFVGGLQSNKGKLLASIPNLYLLETLDSVKAANVLQKALSSPDAPKRDEPLRVYLQVNTSGEDAKSGQPPILDAQSLDEASRPLLDLAVHVITKCPDLRLRGVMTIGAAANSANTAAGQEAKSVEDLVSANPDFEKLIRTRKNLVALLRSSSDVAKSDAAHIKEAYAQLLAEGGDESGGLELSMGMSADLEVAAMVGSDNVRVGTDCFGRRPGTRDEAMAGMKRELEVGIEAAMAELRSSVQGQGQGQDKASASGKHGEVSASASDPGPLAYQDPLPQKAPLPEEGHVGGLIKFYDVDAAEKLKTTEMVDVVGILDTASLPHAEWQESGSSGTSGNNTSPSVPCVHALFFEPVDINDAQGLAAAGSFGLSDQGKRSAIIDYLSTGLGGDKVAAELVLLSVISRIHSRRASLSLGALTVNLSNFPAPPASGSGATTKISRLLSSLLPSVVDVSMDLKDLNDPKRSFSPRSSGGEVGLEAGRLQLVNGTALVVNEGTMKEGELKEHGIRNIKSLSSVLESHKLPYIFPYSEFEFETDLNVVVLSQGKSFLPFDVQCPLAVASSSSVAGALYGEVDGMPVQDKLEGWRRALLSARTLQVAQAFEIPGEVSEYIQSEFVESRREDKEVGQEDLLRRMALVRLLAISKGEKTLTVDTWKAAVELDCTVSQRRRAAVAQQQHPSGSR